MLEADAKLIILYLFFVRKMTDVFAAWNDCSSAEMEKKNSAGTDFKNCDENFTLWSPQNPFLNNGMGFFG